MEPPTASAHTGLRNSEPHLGSKASEPQQGCCHLHEFYDLRFNAAGAVIKESSIEYSEKSQVVYKVHNEINFFAPEVPSVQTRSEGTIQFGCPPESAKVWMRKGKEVPMIYVLPEPFFQNNLNYADVEFPIYWYAFVKKWVYEGKKLTVVGTEEQIARMRIILTETIFGPQKADLQNAGHSEKEIKRVVEESLHFAAKNKAGTPFTLDDFVNFVPFDADNKAKVGNNSDITITRKNQNEFEVSDAGKVSPVKFTPPQIKSSEVRGSPVQPANFAFTFLGTSSGFDPKGHTTSGIVWINKKGLLIDPLAYVGSHLKTLGIEQIDVPRVLLTHVHGDHDPGLLEYILSDKKIELYTTRIIFESFLRKAKAITGQDFRDKVNFVELVPGVRTKLDEGYYITARNNFHSIPTIGVLIETPNETLCFSGDTYYDPEVIKELVAKKILTEERAKEIEDASFFNVDYLFHEAGIPPIHTPIKPLSELNENRKKLGKKPIILVHKNQNVEKELKVASPCEHYEFSKGTPPTDEEKLKFIQSAFFEDHRSEFLNSLDKDILGKAVSYAPGDFIVRQNHTDKAMFVILEGEVHVVQNGQTVARLAKGNFFGEQSSLLNVPRTADVKANTTTTVLKISEEALDKLTSQNGKIKQLAQNFNLFAPTLFSSEELKSLPIDGIRQLASKLEIVQFEKDTVIFEKGTPGNDMYIIYDGEARVDLPNQPVTLKNGKIFGEMAVLGAKDTLRMATVHANTKLTALKLSRSDFEGLKNTYPNMNFILTRLSQQRTE